MARKTTTPVVEVNDFVVGAETGYAVRQHISNTTAAVCNTTASTKDKVKGFVFGLFGPKKEKPPKQPKVREVRMTPELQKWLANRS